MMQYSLLNQNITVNVQGLCMWRSHCFISNWTLHLGWQQFKFQSILFKLCETSILFNKEE